MSSVEILEEQQQNALEASLVSLTCLVVRAGGKIVIKEEELMGSHAIEMKQMPNGDIVLQVVVPPEVVPS